MFGLAIEDGAVSMNPVRESSARISVGKKSPRALTPEETASLTLALRHRANADGKPLLDFTAKTREVNATVVRVPKQA